MSVRLLFPEGTTLSAPSATEALVLWGCLQWTPVKDPAAIRAALSDRAWEWSRAAINPDLPDDEFLVALDASGLCAVTYDADKANGKPDKPTVTRAPWHERYPTDDDR